ncbi:MAG: VOC family protein [Candidatus Helarchaeota archaeon]
MVRITHIHIPVEDMERARRFYREVFEWEVEDTGSAFQILKWIETESSKKSIYGALYKHQRSQDTPSIVIDVPSIDIYVKKVQKAGGKLVTSKNQISLFGYLAEVTDSEGNLIGFYEEKK